MKYKGHLGVRCH